jgi:hypothetical protein
MLIFSRQFVIEQGSKLQCLICKARKNSALGSRASTTAFIIVIFLKPRTNKFFESGSGQGAGVKDGKRQLHEKNCS